MFSRREILTDSEHVSDQNNHFHRYWTFLKIRRLGFGNSHETLMFASKKDFRYVFVGNFDRL